MRRTYLFAHYLAWDHTTAVGVHLSLCFDKGGDYLFEEFLKNLKEVIDKAAWADKFERYYNDERQNCERLREEKKALIAKYQKEINELRGEIEHLKATHPDYVAVECPSCGGMGGFDTPDGGEICSTCDGSCIIHIPKEEYNGKKKDSTNGV